MKSLDKGKDKIQQISEILKEETLAPAKQEALNIIAEAEIRAQEIIAEAKARAEEIHSEARRTVEKEYQIFESSLSQACKQGVQALRADVEHELFDEELGKSVDQQMADPQVVTKLIDTLLKAIEKDGVSADFSIAIPAKISVDSMNSLLKERAVEKLKKGLIVGDFAGGIKAILHDKQITIDITETALIELLSRYLRKDFRKWLFGNLT